MSTSTLPTGSRSGVVAPRHPQLHVAAVAAILAAVTALLLVRTQGWNQSLVPARPFVAVLVTVAFFVAERVVFNVEYRRETVSFSLSEVPLAFALVFLGPVPAVAARVIGSLAAHSVTRRPTPLKLAFNGAVFATEVALEAYLLRASARSHRQPSGPRSVDPATMAA